MIKPRGGDGRGDDGKAVAVVGVGGVDVEGVGIVVKDGGNRGSRLGGRGWWMEDGYLSARQIQRPIIFTGTHPNSRNVAVGGTLLNRGFSRNNKKISLRPQRRARRKAHDMFSLPVTAVWHLVTTVS